MPHPASVIARLDRARPGTRVQFTAGPHTYLAIKITDRSTGQAGWLITGAEGAYTSEALTAEFGLSSRTALHVLARIQRPVTL